jgi:hypothetical protein
MAENEILDIGNPQRYRRFKVALGNSNLLASDIASMLREDLMSMLKTKLSKNTLYLILQACKQDVAALKDAILAFKEPAITKFVENAIAITKSVDPNVIARKVADLLINRLFDQANVHIAKDKYGLDIVRRREVQNETESNLEACRPEVVDLLGRSLHGEIARATRRQPRGRPRVTINASTSLI